MVDIEDWWPKLRSGGIMAGHDFVTDSETGGQNWSINYGGTVDPSGRAVKGAVIDFASRKLLQIAVSYCEPGFNTWAIRKP
jgi:hypothetical protein